MSSKEKESSGYAALKSLVMEELKEYFRPELLNRIDEMVVFRPLEKAQVYFSLIFLFLSGLSFFASLVDFCVPVNDKI